jgi:hypothetical protein
MTSFILPSGTRDLTDDEFLAAMEAPTLPKDRFRHFDHVRLAWLYLDRTQFPEAVCTMSATIRRFGEHHLGSDARYHDTITRAFMCLVAAARLGAPPDEDFERFADRNAHLFEPNVLERHYSRALLATPRARETWVDPDRLPLPELVPR